MVELGFKFVLTMTLSWSTCVNWNYLYQDSLCAHEKKLNKKHKRSYMGSFALIIALYIYIKEN